MTTTDIYCKTTKTTNAMMIKRTNEKPNEMHKHAGTIKALIYIARQPRLQSIAVSLSTNGLDRETAMLSYQDDQGYDDQEDQ